MINYLFIIMDNCTASSLHDLTPELLKELLTCKVPLAVNCSLLVCSRSLPHS